MVIKDFIADIKKELDGCVLQNYLDIDYTKLRFIGLLYDKFIYKKEYSKIKQVFTQEQIIDSLKNARQFFETIDFAEFDDDMHIINFMIQAVKRNLYMKYSKQVIEEVENNEII